jgi:acetolactate synthase-1/2/3 large subunit
MINGAETLLKCLLDNDVELIFGYPGGAIMPIYDAHYNYQDEIKHILCRHEQGAIHAAQGYARANGKVGVCFATSGPGATNLITGIADAYIDSTPLVCITGQVHSSLLGTDAFQETDVVGISMPVSKWNYQISHVEEIPEIIAKAFYIAKSGRPGPVLIDITKDAQLALYEYKATKVDFIRSYIPKFKLEYQQIEAAALLINQAKKPFVIFGQGIILANAELELRLLIEKGNIPSAWTIMGLSALDNTHQLNMGMLGMHGNYAPNMLTNECDVLIAVGMRFDDRVTGNLASYAKQAKIIHIEIDPAEIDKNVKANVAIISDAKEALNALIPLIEERDHSAWIEQFKSLKKEEDSAVINEELHPTREELSMGEVIHQLNLLSEGNAIIVSDVGQHQMQTCRYAKFTQTRSNITSGGLGTMGFCLPAAIGAKLAKPERLVVAIAGDGGIQMTIQELGTIMQNKIDLKIIILNNNFLGMVRQWQELFFEKRYASTEMQNPNYQLIAQGYGIASIKVSKRKDLQAALKHLLEFKGAFLLEIMVAQENNVFPMIETGKSVSEIRLR